MDTTNQIAVECRGLVKVYGEGSSQVVALRGIDLEVRTGELLMLVGPSGCGKTTLISVIAGILDQTEGDCRVFGRNLLDISVREKTQFRGATVGFVFQAFNLLPALSAAENVAIPLMLNGISYPDALRRSCVMLDQVGLGERTSSLPTQLSGGQMQRVAIARALIHNPRLVVCDEPTSALDHETGHKVMEMMRKVALAEGRALVIVTHDARIFEFADRIAKMDDGHIMKVVSSPQEL